MGSGALYTIHESLSNILLRCLSRFALLATRRHAMFTALFPTPMAFPISPSEQRAEHRSRASHSATRRASLLRPPVPGFFSAKGVVLYARATRRITVSMFSAANRCRALPPFSPDTNLLPITTV